MKRKPIGRFIAADPKVCHGQLTFRGTRILVSDVLELVAAGLAWDKIIEECHGSISRGAIAEAIRFAGRALAEKAGFGVIVLDENILASQRLALAVRHIHLCQIGAGVGRKGMQDDEIVALLRQIRRPSFFTRDRDFFQKALCSDKLCVAQLDVGPLQIADYIRRFLRHPDFKAWSQRRGCVVRVSANGITVWRAHASRVVRYRWQDGR